MDCEALRPQPVQEMDDGLCTGRIGLSECNWVVPAGKTKLLQLLGVK